MYKRQFPSRPARKSIGSRRRRGGGRVQKPAGFDGSSSAQAAVVVVAHVAAWYRRDDPRAASIRLGAARALRAAVVAGVAALVLGLLCVGVWAAVKGRVRDQLCDRARYCDGEHYYCRRACAEWNGICLLYTSPSPRD